MRDIPNISNRIQMPTPVTSPESRISTQNRNTLIHELLRKLRIRHGSMHTADSMLNMHLHQVPVPVPVR